MRTKFPLWTLGVVGIVVMIVVQTATPTPGADGELVGHNPTTRQCPNPGPNPIPHCTADPGTGINR